MASMPISSLLRYHGPRRPSGERVLVHPEGTLTWRELEERSNQRARQFASLGVKQGDFVTIALPNGNAFFEYSFATWKLGATPNVVSHRLPAPEFAAILDLVKPALVVHDAASSARGWRALDPEASAQGYSPDPLPDAVAPFWKAMTSGGSTGRPKVIVDHKPGDWAPGESMVDQIEGDIVLNPGPLYHNAPFVFTHNAIFVGGSVVGMRRFDPEEALRTIEARRVSWVNFVPTMMNRIWALPEPVRNHYDISSLRLVWHMASSMPPWLKSRWIDWLGPERILELYGGTERQGYTRITGEEWLRKPGSVGRAAGGTQMKVLREDGSECRPGEHGEVFFIPVDGPGTTYHYLGSQPRAIDGGWESIGDIGAVDEDGYLFLADRRSDLIVRGGANIYPAEVEAALDAHPQVAASVVVGLPDDDLGHKVHAIVLPTDGDPPDPQILNAYLEGELAKYKRPESYEFVSEQLRDDAGKVRRTALRDLRIAWLGEGRDFRLPIAAGPRSATAQRIDS
jgi:bile acid-coenzyme A ligase